MADKVYPWFKFTPDSWISGKITLEDYYVQGLFSTICAYYWKAQGKLSLNEIKRRLSIEESETKAKAFQIIMDRIISEKNGFIVIKFLDEQFREKKNLSKTNSKNGKHGGRGNKRESKDLKEIETKAKALFSESESQAKKSNIEEEEDKEEELRIYNTLGSDRDANENSNEALSPKNQNSRDPSPRVSGAPSSKKHKPWEEDPDFMLFKRLHVKFSDSPSIVYPKWLKLNSDERKAILEGIVNFCESRSSPRYVNSPLVMINRRMWESPTWGREPKHGEDKKPDEQTVTAKIVIPRPEYD